MRMKVVLTKKEFEDALTNAVNCYADKPLVEAVYPRLDGGIEFTLTTLEGPAREQVAPAGEMPRPRLWTPDPPPFIHSVAPTPEEAGPPEGYIGWWPEKVDHAGEFSGPCSCGTYGVYSSQGWADDNGLHTREKCPPKPISDAAALSASSTGEHGTIDGDDDIPF